MSQMDCPCANGALQAKCHVHSPPGLDGSGYIFHLLAFLSANIESNIYIFTLYDLYCEKCIMRYVLCTHISLYNKSRARVEIIRHVYYLYCVLHATY